MDNGFHAIMVRNATYSSDRYGETIIISARCPLFDDRDGHMDESFVRSLGSMLQSFETSFALSMCVPGGLPVCCAIGEKTATSSLTVTIACLSNSHRRFEVRSKFK